uniref:Thioester reductase (TE) domain-containing protein n=1 Tax=Branchiostoma floridae TaxID=7739 RepID=C3Y5F6_BRAFL|eukprot:XP_002608193.1 hypothetical protein BRAFLDRAFT_90375 [Branchiostoma floridae]
MADWPSQDPQATASAAVDDDWGDDFGGFEAAEPIQPAMAQPVQQGITATPSIWAQLSTGAVPQVSPGGTANQSPGGVNTDPAQGVPFHDGGSQTPESQELCKTAVLQQQELCEKQLQAALTKETERCEELLQKQHDRLLQQLEEDRGQTEERVQVAIKQQQQKDQEEFEKVLAQEREKSQQAIQEAVKAEQEAGRDALQAALQEERGKSRDLLEEQRAELQGLLQEERDRGRQAVEEAVREERKRAKDVTAAAVEEERQRGREAVSRAVEQAQQEMKLYITEQRKELCKTAVLQQQELCEKQLQAALTKETERCEELLQKQHDRLLQQLEEDRGQTEERVQVAIKQQQQKDQAFVHVSTAYANCDRSYIEEVIYPPPVQPQKLIDALEWMDDTMVTKLTPDLIGKRPNTYTFTKACAEYLLTQEAADLPLSIVRPSIIGASWREPLVIGKGLLRTMRGEYNAYADIIPVDLPANLMIAVAWDTAVSRPENIPVYNSTSGGVNPFRWGEIEGMLVTYFKKYPLDKPFRRPNCAFVSNSFMYQYWQIVSHKGPAYLYDIWLRMIGQKPRSVSSVCPQSGS